MIPSLILAASLVAASPVQDAAAPDPAASAEPSARPAPHYLDDDPLALDALAHGMLDPSSVDSHCAFCDRVVTADDAEASAVEQGIVWYGVWEDAVAEVERTGRPLLVHFGSPRVMQVCGVW